MSCAMPYYTPIKSRYTADALTPELAIAWDNSKGHHKHEKIVIGGIME